jgi:alpha-glucoside transport system permease protein
MVEQRSRSWIFLTPALLFVTGGLLVPLARTVYLSFKDRDEAETIGLRNYWSVFVDDNEFINFDRWGLNAFTHSWLFWIAAVLIAAGLIGGIVAGRTTRRAFEQTGVSMGPLSIGLFLLACSLLATARGTLFNNIWWVVVVTAVATSVGLAVAVLADRSKGENIAKALIFLPMAISFVGASVIWRLMYQARNARDAQTGVLNGLWVGLGKLSNSMWPKIVAAILLIAIIAGLLYLVGTGIRAKMNTRIGFSGVLAVLFAVLLWRLLGPGLGGASRNNQGVLVGDPILFLEDDPFNNMWLMLVLIWIQTGFAMVILSSAIKGVPQELTEAARIDGATETQVFWRVTMPQIAPTIGVVVTTLMITVMKVFDIVRVMTNGDYRTQVIANQMFEAGIFNNNSGLGATLATLLFVAVLPIMYINIRRMQKAKN